MSEPGVVTAPSTYVPQARARSLMRGFNRAPVVIIGDVMLDQFVVGRVDRISPEAPVPVVAFQRDEYRIGGAANVAHNARMLGGEVELVGVIGADAAGERLLGDLRSREIGTAGVTIDTTRRTTTKMRIVTDRNQQVARVDYESEADVPPAVEQTLAASIDRLAVRAGALIVSDYLKGCITSDLMRHLLAAALRHHVPVLVDPKIPHLECYRGARLITPNHHEAEIATHTRIRTDAEARAAARAFRERAGCDGVLITRGELGMWVLDGACEGSLPAAAREVADVTGAGDTVIATLALAVSAGATIAEAAALANQAAGIVVGKFGPATVTPAELAAASLVD